MVGQTKAAVNAKGELVMPFNGLNGKPRHWVEVAPFVWHDPDDHKLVAAKVVDGKAVRFSMDELSPFMVFDRVPRYANNAWLMPLLVASIAALLLTALLWPVTAWVRRRYQSPLHLDDPSFRAYRWSKISALLILLTLGLWALTFVLMLKDNNNLDGRLDWLVWLDEIVGTLQRNRIAETEDANAHAPDDRCDEGAVGAQILKCGVARAAEVHLNAVDEHLEFSFRNRVALDRLGEHAQDRVVAVVADRRPRRPSAGKKLLVERRVGSRRVLLCDVGVAVGSVEIVGECVGPR